MGWLISVIFWKASSLSVIGSNIIPLSDLLTFLTSLACLSIDMFLWITPIPPCCAIDMASSCSAINSWNGQLLPKSELIMLDIKSNSSQQVPFWGQNVELKTRDWGFDLYWIYVCI